MDNGLFVTLLVIVVVIVVIVVQRKLATKRREAFFALAQLGSWEFSPGKDFGIARLCDFDVFNKGEDRYAYNTITGKVTYGPYACELDMGDFCYTTRTRDSKGHRRSSTHHLSYLVIRLPFRDTPAVRIRREGLLDSITQALGFEDIDFESEEFSRKYCVTGSDKRFVYDLIHPRAMEYFLAIEPPALIEIKAGRLCVTDGVRRWDIESFKRRMTWAKSFVALWPEHLARDLPKRTI